MACLNFNCTTSALYLPDWLKEASLSDEQCRQCTNNPRMVKIVTMRGRMTPFYPDRYTGCLGGCDLNLLQVLDVPKLNVRRNKPFKNFVRQNGNRGRGDGRGARGGNKGGVGAVPMVGGGGGSGGGGTEAVNCNCGLPSARRTVAEEGPNKGREFYNCTKSWKEQCRYFQWAGEKVEEIKRDCNLNIIKGEDDGILLNEVDSTGLPKVMQGIDLEEVKQFAADFKAARLSLGLTQTQVGQALSSNTNEEGVTVSQSTICRFEKLEITALQVKKLLPALQSWLQEAKERHRQGLPVIVQEAVDGRDNKKRKKRTVFNQGTVNALNVEFDRQPCPSSQQLAFIAEKMGLDKETVRVWFCNKRQNLKKNGSGSF